MKAKLVRVSFIIRVVVEDNATEDEILDAAKSELHNKVQNELPDSLDSIDEDKDCPYGTFDGELA